MAELFSELYSCYYQVVARVLRKAAQTPLSRGEITALVEEEAFGESGLYLIPRLCGGDWTLLRETPEGFAARTAPPPRLPLTGLQLSWLKAVLGDKRARLFLSDEELSQADALLEGVKPLFFPSDFWEFDVFKDGDNYLDSGYRQRFARLLAAIRAGETVKIHYLSPKGRETAYDYLPCKLEYSQKDDKFRLYAARVAGDGAGEIRVLNLGRITRVESARRQCRAAVDLERWFAENRSEQPVRLQIFRERNALERCMLHFASYEKRTEYDEESDSFFCSIYYERQDETELLIRVLSFGPVVRVLGPEHFLREVRARVARQHRLMMGEESKGPGNTSGSGEKQAEIS